LLVGTCVLALAIAAGVRAADDEKKKDEKKPVATTFNAMFKELVTKYRAAEDQKEKDKLLTSYAEKFLDLARKNPTDEGTLRVLLQTLALPLPASKDGPKTQVLAILEKDHVKSPKLGPH